MNFQKIFFFFSFILTVHLAFAQDNAYKVSAVGFYNLENLFDTLHVEGGRDEEFTPKGAKAYTREVYFDKLGKLARVISEAGTEMTPDGLAILGVCEVENITVLEDLVKEEAIADRNYQIAHIDSPDERGIDVGLLYNPKYFAVTNMVATPILMFRSDSSRNFTRDILLVSGKADGEELHILVNHWPSRGGQDAAEKGRNQGGELNRNIIDSLQNINPAAKILVMGDLNDNPNDDSVAKYLGAKKDKKKLKKTDMYNPYYKLYRKGYGSTAWRDTWSLFDQVIVSGGLVLNDPAEGWHFYQAKVMNKPYMIQKSGQYKGYPMRAFSGDTYTGGYSDHFPSYVFLIKKS